MGNETEAIGFGVPQPPSGGEDISLVEHGIKLFNGENCVEDLFSSVREDFRLRIDNLGLTGRKLQLAHMLLNHVDPTEGIMAPDLAEMLFTDGRTVESQLNNLSTTSSDLKLLLKKVDLTIGKVRTKRNRRIYFLSYLNEPKELLQDKAYNLVPSLGSEKTDQKPEDENSHPHHWVIDSPNGSHSSGICRNCGQKKEFKNSYDDKWDLRGKPTPEEIRVRNALNRL